MASGLKLWASLDLCLKTGLLFSKILFTYLAQMSVQYMCVLRVIVFISIAVTQNVYWLTMSVNE